MTRGKYRPCPFCGEHGTGYYAEFCEEFRREYQDRINHGPNRRFIKTMYVARRGMREKEVKLGTHQAH